jgi:hypothetical protein
LKTIWLYSEKKKLILKIFFIKNKGLEVKIRFKNYGGRKLPLFIKHLKRNTMKNPYVNWVKVYHINHFIGPVRFYLSSHMDGSFHGMVIYAKRKGNLSEGCEIELDFEDQRFYGNNEDFVYDGAMQFINDNLGNNFQVTLFSETEM